MRLAAAVALACALSCATPARKPPPPRVWGELRELMHGGATGPAVTVKEVLAQGYNHALGALGGLRGELMIDRGEVCVTYGDTGGARGEGRDEDAALLVAARVEGWRDLRVEADIPAAELDARLEAMLGAAGVDLSSTTPVPIRIQGTLTDLAWHVVSPAAIGGSHADHQTAGPHGVIPRTDADVLVGFFSRHHEGVFTHMGQATHLHACRGHVDAVGVSAGAVVQIPR